MLNVSRPAPGFLFVFQWSAPPVLSFASFLLDSFFFFTPADDQQDEADYGGVSRRVDSHGELLDHCDDQIDQGGHAGDQAEHRRQVEGRCAEADEPVDGIAGELPEGLGGLAVQPVVHLVGDIAGVEPDP